jgi:hypothetical protein
MPKGGMLSSLRRLARPDFGGTKTFHDGAEKMRRQIHRVCLTADDAY